MYTVALYSLSMDMKEDNPGWNYVKGDNWIFFGFDDILRGGLLFDN